MNCHQARIYLSPYLDSELDQTTTYEVSRHLQGCSACAELFAAEEALERAIGGRLRRRQGDEEQLIERALSRIAFRTRLSAWRNAVAVAAILLLLGLFAYRLVSAGTGTVPEIVTMAAKDHRRYLAGEIAPELLTRDPADVSRFFEGRLAGETGSLPSGNGWEVEGARVCHFHDLDIGFVTLRYHGIPVSVVDMPSGVTERALDLGLLRSDERCFELSGGRGILRRTGTGFRVAFGDLEMAKLEEVVQAAR